MPTSARCPRGAHRLRRAALLFLLHGLLCASLSGAFELTILHTNDVHARVEETSRDAGKCARNECYGGVARRATKIQEIRATHRNVLLLDAGDQYQGTVWFTYFKGREVVRFMNLLRYDAMGENSRSITSRLRPERPHLRIASHSPENRGEVGKEEVPLAGTWGVRASRRALEARCPPHRRLWSGSGPQRVHTGACPYRLSSGQWSGGVWPPRISSPPRRPLVLIFRLPTPFADSQ
ncbi:hypothetical protein JRQ81_006522, partial [Phrynocephalus forsythii]